MDSIRPDSASCQPGSELNTFEVYFKGTSMRGVFRPGDRLTIQPCIIDELEAGDIIVFRISDHDIVHRIVEHHGTDLTTWGDSNPFADPEPVRSENLRGKVISINRHGRIQKIRHGLVGLRKGRKHRLFWRTFFQINHRLNRLLCPGSLSWLYHITPTLLQLNHQKEIKLVYNKRTIGRFDPQSGFFHLRKPWYYFVSQRFITDRLGMNQHPSQEQKP